MPTRQQQQRLVVVTDLALLLYVVGVDAAKNTRSVQESRAEEV
jgi:hypothetical protein